MTTGRLSVAAPAYNEAEGIGPLVESWLAYLRSSATVREFEIVICNDGSRDQTGAILDQLAARNAEVRPVHHRVNQGAAAAVATAIVHTTGDWVLLMDSDGQFPIGNLPRMCEAAHSAAAVIGVRQRKLDSPWARFGSWASGALCNCFHRSRIRDFNCALKLVAGPLARSLPLEARGLNYSGEITSRLLEAGVPLAEVVVEHRPRGHGVSSARAWRSARDRFLFVVYIGLRQLLLQKQVLRRNRYDGSGDRAPVTGPAGLGGDAGHVEGRSVLRRPGIEHDHPGVHPLAAGETVPSR
jgi:glycosyltransferase involved in cell wall biosynthesis